MKKAREQGEWMCQGKEKFICIGGHLEVAVSYFQTCDVQGGYYRSSETFDWEYKQKGGEQAFVSGLFGYLKRVR